MEGHSNESGEMVVLRDLSTSFKIQAKIIEVMVKNMYSREQHPKPMVGVKTMMITAAVVIPHWRIRAKNDVLNIEINTPRGNTMSSAGGVAVQRQVFSSVGDQ